MQAKAYATKAAALAAIAKVNAVKGYPRTEVGVRVGGGIHAATITTTSEADPIALKDGTFAVEAAVLRIKFAIAEKDLIDVTAASMKETP